MNAIWGELDGVLGFTGSQDGMTNDQLIAVHMLLGEFKEQGARYARHGMCVGADEKFHFMAVAMHYVVFGHPGVRKDGLPWKRGSQVCTSVLPEKPFLKRNRNIVDDSHVLIATPKEFLEQLRSGTWSTVRYARKKKMPLCLVYPDGVIQKENW